MKKNEKNYKIITADDHSVVTKSLGFILKDMFSNAEVYELDNLSEVMKKIESTSIDLLILDVSFPDGNSLNLIPTLRKLQPHLKILIFSGHDEDIYAIRYVQAGASGYLNKLSNEAEIQNAIHTVMNSGKYFSKYIQEKITDSYLFRKPINPMDQLSNRELEIARLMVEGYGNIEICAALDLQKSTVSTYKTRIFEKLEVENLSDLIQLFSLYKEV
ncbi:response regulator transcription factor [Flavobacterium sp. CBA20B-1]|uniref:response regulator transcription factor n=1 Tax=unclassified Flavobacterium TaxID=196869 RepID=UPI002225616C|nr:MULTISPECIES: response regulator transcription factor [unclassified Flavobacterium]WCM41249.1 response regulator transcription factor [Flavobacterium sp. CBA20B-1]